VLPPHPSDSYVLEDVMVRKAHVRDASGGDVRNACSSEFRLEDVMARKAKVSEADRTAPRTINRMAPPGLKGFIGAEYSPGYYAQDGVVVRQRLRPSRADMQVMELQAAMDRAARLGAPQSFAQKEAAMAGYWARQPWTSRTSAADNGWLSVCWSAEVGLFVAVSNSGSGNRVMTCL